MCGSENPFFGTQNDMVIIKEPCVGGVNAVWHEYCTSVTGSAGVDPEAPWSYYNIRWHKVLVTHSRLAHFSRWFFFFFFSPSCPKNKQTKVSKSLTFKILRRNHFWILPPPISLFPTVFWLQSKRPPYLIAYWVGSFYRRALHYSLDTVHVTGSITVTISILKWQGQFPAFSHILLCNLIANASPVSAPLAFISMLPTPLLLWVQSYSSCLNLFLLLYHQVSPSFPRYLFGSV